MGLLSRISGSSVATGSHSIQSSNVFSALADQVDPTTKIEWTTSNPTVIKAPKGATLADADRAEKEAADYENACDNGVRLLKAEARKQKSHAKLVVGHRQYLGSVAQSHLEANAANRGLAGKMLGLRQQYAQLGYSLERKIETSNQRVDEIKARLVG